MRTQKGKRQPLFLLLAIAIVLSACSQAGKGESSENKMDIAISPAAYPVNAALLSCAASGLADDQQLIVDSRIVDSTELENFDFIIQLGEMSGRLKMVAHLADENLVVILHTSNPLRRLNPEQIAGLFSGGIRNWSLLEGNDAEVALWIGLKSDEGRGAFVDGLLAGRPVSGNARLAASPKQMLEAVRNDVNAIGLLPAAWADSSVQSLDSGMKMPVLAIAEGEISGEARAIIACLQGEQGQAILAESYPR